MIEEWIRQVNIFHEPERRSCSFFCEHFKGFYSPEFLETAYFVVTDTIPKPDFPELLEAGLGGFIDMEFGGITYNDTYYVTKSSASEISLHFHELVHVIQWRELTPTGFIQRYIQEIQDFGYERAPLEKMAYTLQKDYELKKHTFDVAQYVRGNL